MTEPVDPGASAPNEQVQADPVEPNSGDQLGEADVNPLNEDGTPKTVEEVIEELYELKANGQTEKVSLEELKKRASHATGAAKAMSEAKQLKADADKLLKMLKDSPFDAIAHLNPDASLEELVTNKLAELMEQKMMTPEELQRHNELQELKQWKAEKARQEAIQRQAEQEALDQQEGHQMDTEVAAALAKVGLKAPAAAARVISLALEVREAGMNPDLEAIAAHIKAEMKQELLDLISDPGFEGIDDVKIKRKAQAAPKTVGQDVEPTKPGERKPKAPEKKKFVTADDILRRSQGR